MDYLNKQITKIWFVIHDNFDEFSTITHFFVETITFWNVNLWTTDYVS